MKAVVNSSPLISLALLNHVELLKMIFDEIFIPKSVYDEITIKGKGKIGGSEDNYKLDGFVIYEALNLDLKNTIMLELDEGEAEVIAIAKEKDVPYVIIDEFAGRQFAALLGFKVVGTLGILIIGKELGVIREIRPLLDTMIKNNRYIDSDLYYHILKKAGEA